MSDLNNNIANENSAARERGSSVAREYERVTTTFNKVLSFKEKVRLESELRIRELGNHLKINIDKLNTLDRNIEIYDSNILKVANNLEDLLAEEVSVKEKYNRLLQGEQISMVGVSIGFVEAPDNEISGIEPSTENLIQQRHHYLDNLSSSFQILDNDLNALNSLQSEMITARSEIFKKKEIALEQKAELMKNGHALREDMESLETHLEISVKEEEVLTLEYAQLINKVESCIVIGEDIDRVLFASLTGVD
jgi:septal ring factor EnvC (AmiA/AmiB activator)